MLLPQPIETQSLQHPIFDEKKVNVSLLRLDQIHSGVSGNKFFKLKYNLEEAKKLGKPSILTFGGAYSNHIYATASAAREAGLTSIGIIRGEGLDRKNPTLLHARERGMLLHFVSRVDYRKKNSEEYIDHLRAHFGDFYLIPEGGTNSLAIQGTAEILEEKHREFSHVCTALGTGGTFAGLAKSLNSAQTLLGFSSLKGEFIREEIENLLIGSNIHPKGRLEIFTQFHFGGYAKWTDELIDFIHWFWKAFGVILDPIYTGKMAFGFWELLQTNHFPAGSKILLIHTGGLQGNLGFTQRTGIALPTP
ncbi:1-aminocyclopropane-1-carboxylate deaminase [Algoriphagus sp. AK58]|nr:1-aminocyclopropane-1-carboxylate deaminase [Algoriphagus sp. AK58]